MHCAAHSVRCGRVSAQRSSRCEGRRSPHPDQTWPERGAGPGAGLRDDRLPRLIAVMPIGRPNGHGAYLIPARSGWAVLRYGRGSGYSTEHGPHFCRHDRQGLRAARRGKAADEPMTTGRHGQHPGLVHAIGRSDRRGAWPTAVLLSDTTCGRSRQDGQGAVCSAEARRILVIADHAARPEDGATVGKTYHRIAESTLRSEIEAAGFKFVADAGFLRHPEDARTAIVFHNPTPVDEFVLKFQKPQ